MIPDKFVVYENLNVKTSLFQMILVSMMKQWFLGQGDPWRRKSGSWSQSVRVSDEDDSELRWKEWRSLQVRTGFLIDGSLHSTNISLAE